ARYLRKLVLAHGREALPQPALLHSCRADPLLYDATTAIYWPAVRAGQLTITTDDVMVFIRAAEDDGRIPVPWSSTITPYVAHGVLACWAGFGLLGERVRGGYRVASYRLDDRAAVYLAYDLHFAGCTDACVVAHRDWALFGIEEADVAGRLRGWRTRAGGRCSGAAASCGWSGAT